MSDSGERDIPPEVESALREVCQIVMERTAQVACELMRGRETQVSAILRQEVGAFFMPSKDELRLYAKERKRWRGTGCVDDPIINAIVARCVVRILVREEEHN